MFSHLIVARVTIETRSPLSIGAGSSDQEQQILIVRDANGLPLIPGTTLAGVLRGLFEESYQDPAAARRLFGKERPGSIKTSNETETYEASRVSFSSAHIHDDHDVPVDGLVLDPHDTRFARPLAKLLRQSKIIKRDHVRIDGKGTAEDGAKFDRSAVPVGCRFTFDIQFLADASNDPLVEQLLACLRHPAVRFGAAVHGGYGQVRIIRVKRRAFQLASQADRKALTDWGRRLDRAIPDAVQLTRTDIAIAPTSYLDLSIPVSAQDMWRIGSEGGKPIASHTDLAGDLIKSIQSVTYREKRISWHNEGDAQVAQVFDDERVVIPATSIKGTLRHRVAYHALCEKLRQDHANYRRDVTSPLEQSEVNELFGFLKSSGQEDGETGSVGSLMIDDIEFDVSSVTPVLVQHNGIDRFAGGVRNGILFAEEMILQSDFSLRIVVRNPQRISGSARRALKAAIVDLVEGRLAIGAGSSKGHGYLRGTFPAAYLADHHWFAGEVS